MSLLSPEQYVKQRENYSYEACTCDFSIAQTGNLLNTGNFRGIFPKRIPLYYPKGINLRHFEQICQEVFQDCQLAIQNDHFSVVHENNLKNIAAVIVYWKMASQGGRAPNKKQNLLSKWHSGTGRQLINAYQKRDLGLFRIGGVRIPTASAFLRFLFPGEFGIIDSRVTKNYTQPNGITDLSVRTDNYINDTEGNIRQYHEKYIPFLRNEAKWLNDQRITFIDYDSSGTMINSPFRPCDIEMALF